eukprot:4353265-Pleurochrysis_carterae.AAC.1
MTELSPLEARAALCRLAFGDRAEVAACRLQGAYRRHLRHLSVLTARRLRVSKESLLLLQQVWARREARAAAKIQLLLMDRKRRRHAGLEDVGRRQTSEAARQKGLEAARTAAAEDAKREAGEAARREGEEAARREAEEAAKKEA